jgi:hypothetical protein
MSLKRRGLVFCFFTLFLSIASAVKADTLTFAGTAGNITLNVTDAAAGYTAVNAVIDPYKGIFDGNTVLMWCVDPDHEVSPNSPWNVNVSKLGGNLSQTYLNNATTYGEMAWLITQFQGASASTQQELQAAIWLLADPGDFTVNVPTTNTTFWTAVNADKANAAKNVLTSDFVILTDTRGDTPYSEQEFMVMTPEPPTFLLLALGFIVLVLFTYSKRSGTGTTFGFKSLEPSK